MKKIFMFALLALLGMTQMAAQEYVPFVREGVKWVCYYNNSDSYFQIDQYFKPGKTYFTLELKGDVEINGNTYKAMHKYSGDAIDPENDTVLICLREQDKVVYGIVPDGKTYPDFHIGYGFMHPTEYPYSEIDSGQEFVLYDFNDTDGWCGWIYRRHPDLIANKGVDLIDVGGKPANRHTYMITAAAEIYQIFFIEGIGVDGFYSYPLNFLNVGFLGPSYYLSHVIENSDVIYKGINYEYIAPHDGRLPIAREGMKWVNERVIINNGDTTRYYYSYEIRGDDSSDMTHQYMGYKYCHFYMGDKPDPDNDSIICSLAEAPDYYITWVSGNHAMDEVEKEGRNMLQRRHYYNDSINEQLYFIRHDDPGYTISEYYSWQFHQWPLSITRDNFFEVDPVEIDGHECRRYAFVGEDGEPLAYVVEGIGFDSRDMGDLLTPFTRKPDPESDYQEYCGLSHVIKDGKIIYKGMRYREDVPDMPYGDVNGDGEVTIDDVTAMIDLLLSGGSPRYGANITISDVIDLIDMLLADGQAED